MLLSWRKSGFWSVTCSMLVLTGRLWHIDSPLGCVCLVRHVGRTRIGTRGPVCSASTAACQCSKCVTKGVMYAAEQAPGNEECRQGRAALL